MTETNLHRHILMIDDNPDIHADFRKILTLAADSAPSLRLVEASLFDVASAASPSPRFQVDFAFQGQEGLELIQRARQKGRPYAVVFVDNRMPPGWDGVETIAHLWRADADLQVVFTTAYSDYSWDEILNRFGHSDQLVVLKKPFENIEVLQLAHTLTQKWLLLQQSRENTCKLEARVAARTSELQAANEKLRREIAERQRAEENFRQSQKMEAIGQLAGGVSHDFNNMLTVIRGYAQCLIEDQSLDTKVRGPLQQIDGAAERATNLIRQLLAFSRKQVLQPESLNLNDVIGHITKMLYRLIGEDIALQIESTPNTSSVMADRCMMEQVLLNLVVNARDAMPRGGRLLVQTAVVEITHARAAFDSQAQTGNFVCLSVTDSGCGIPPEILPRIFEPFFTTKEVGKGTGLGLATVYGIVKQHEGWIEVESAVNQGTTFKLFFPACALPAACAPVTGHDANVAGGREVILLVEDDLSLRNATRHVLQRYGYRIITAVSGAHALKVWAMHAAEIDLLLTDMIMPDGVSGHDLAQRLQVEKPGLKVMYTSGYPVERAERDHGLQAEDHFLAKPYTPEPLATMIRTCLNGKPRRSAPSDLAVNL